MSANIYTQNRNLENIQM